MATRQVLVDMAQAWQQQGGAPLQIESVGGVDAAKRVQEGEAFDVVFLASDAIAKLEAAGKVVAGSKVDLMRSGVSACVRAGAPLPDLSSEEAVKQAVLAAPSVGYSTGPSGTALVKLFERWGIAGQLKDRLMQATPGVPVASMVAEGKVALGFQQLSELIHVQGITIVGPLPDAIQITTIFSGGVGAASPQPGAVRRLLASMASAETVDAKRRQGMEAA